MWRPDEDGEALFEKDKRRKMLPAPLKEGQFTVLHDYQEMEAYDKLTTRRWASGVAFLQHVPAFPCLLTVMSERYKFRRLQDGETLDDVIRLFTERGWEFVKPGKPFDLKKYEEL